MSSGGLNLVSYQDTAAELCRKPKPDGTLPTARKRNSLQIEDPSEAASSCLNCSGQKADWYIQKAERVLNLESCLAKMFFKSEGERLSVVAQAHVNRTWVSEMGGSIMCLRSGYVVRCGLWWECGSENRPFPGELKLGAWLSPALCYWLLEGSLQVETHVA